MSRSWLGARLIDVPRQLEDVTTTDAAEAPAEQADLPQSAVDAIWRATECLYRSGAYPAVALCLRRRGAMVLNRTLGHARGNGPDGDEREPRLLARPDTPICLFSASKAVTAILIHKLAEEGGIDLDRPVAHYIPEFAAEGKGRTTIAQVLAHRGGFPTFDNDGISVETLLDWEHCVATVCAARPTGRGGSSMAYHAITGGFVLGEIVRRVTGDSIQAYLDSRLRRPLDMRYFSFGLPEADRPDAALNYAAGQPVRFPLSVMAERALGTPFDRVVEVSNTDLFMRAVVPSGNVYATAEELSRFYRMLLDGGVWNGRRVLEEATVKRAIRPAGRLRFDRTLRIPMRYSEGLMLGADPVGLYGPMTGRAYGHLGFMNIIGWADPDRDLSAALLVTGKALFGGHLIPLARLLATIGWNVKRET